ncbi:MAG: amidohydrolase family protein [Alphaproteobacteria bacterium]|nr:amidohydrolase family protein [Alphaproteobacteria bacterium]
MTDQNAWLKSGAEAALEPDLPILDPHHHLWDHPATRYLLEDILADTGEGHNIRATVFVECGSMYRAAGPTPMRPVGETEFVNGVAAMSASGAYGDTRVAAGIVGYADLTLGAAVSAVLTAHQQRAPDRFRGIRHSAAWDSTDAIRNGHTNLRPGMLMDRIFREGFAMLAEHNMSFDAWLYHPQLPELIDLARSFPETTIILDHVGGVLGVGPYAGRSDEIFASWAKSITELARCENVVVKLGGLGMKMAGRAWHKHPQPPSSEELAEAWKPYLMHCIDAFGPSRGMFESNFPVDKASCGYGVLWNAFKRIAVDFSDDEKSALFHDNAARVYQL